MTTILTPTTELGIVGLVISSLISLIGYLVYSGNKRDDKRTTTFHHTISEVAEKHDQTIRDIVKEHREERSEWRVDANERQAKTDMVIDELRKTIQDANTPKPGTA